jgi:hypothetical protein
MHVPLGTRHSTVINPEQGQMEVVLQGRNEMVTNVSIVPWEYPTAVIVHHLEN